MICRINTASEYIDYLRKHIDMSDADIKHMIGESLLYDRFGIKQNDVRKHLVSIQNGTLDETDLFNTYFNAKKPSNNAKELLSKASLGVQGKARGNASYELNVKELSKHNMSVKDYRDIYDLYNLGKYHVSFYDFLADLAALKKQKESYSANGESKPDTNALENNTPGKNTFSLDTVDSYEFLLIKYLSEKKDASYLEKEIKTFAVSNGIHKIVSDYSNDIRLDLSLMASGEHPKSRIAAKLSKSKRKSEILADPEFETTIKNIITEHIIAVDNNVLFRNILWDYFPNRKMEISILEHLFGYGINADIRNTEVIDDFFVMKYADRLTRDYGIEIAIAKTITEIWCNAYKECI